MPRIVDANGNPRNPHQTPPASVMNRRRWWQSCAVILALVAITTWIVLTSIFNNVSKVETTPPIASQAAQSDFTPTRRPDVPTATFTPVLSLGLTPVTHNIDWKPVIQNIDGMEMVLVPAGCFVMGTTQSEFAKIVTKCVLNGDSKEDCEGQFSDELPAHQICFDDPYWIGRFEVTNAQYQQCVNAGACASPEDSYSTVFYEPERPVIGVDWFNAQRYTMWLSEKTGEEFRLPTEAEWEYAARGPDSLVYPWGNTFVADNLVYEGNSAKQTRPVGSKPEGTSWVGASDVSGNVWEWTNTIYRNYPYTAYDGRENMDTANAWRILRGGSWGDNSNTTRAAYRFGVNVYAKLGHVGFRVALYPSP